MVNPLDSMAWSIGLSAALLGIAAIRLPYKASSGSVEDTGRNLRLGFAIALGASGLYLFLNGLVVSLSTYFPGVYPILFGGVASLGGLALIATSIALFLNAGLREVSYFAFVAGVYAIVDAYSMVKARLTSSPELAALAWLSFAAAAIFSVPATHTDNKWLRRLFAVFAFLFAIAWLYEAVLFTLGHLGAR